MVTNARRNGARACLLLIVGSVGLLGCGGYRGRTVYEATPVQKALQQECNSVEDLVYEKYRIGQYTKPQLDRQLLLLDDLCAALDARLVDVEG